MIIIKAKQADDINIHRLIADVLGRYNLYHLRPDFVDNYNPVATSIPLQARVSFSI
jgi:hypothetical protein